MATPPAARREPGVQRGFPVPVGGSTNNMSAATGANSAAVATLAGTTTGITGGSTNSPPVMCGGIWWSYSGAPTGGNLKISDGTGNFLDMDVTAGGPGFYPFLPPISLAAGTQATLTLAAGGSGVTGKCGFHAWQEF